MADFSFLSDGSDEESAVEDLLSQAMDHSVLEQIAAINCSSFTSDSLLPTHLETRFRRLKSLPPTTKPSRLSTHKNSSASFNSSHFHNPFEEKPQLHSLSDDDENKGSKPKLGSGSGSSPSKSSNSSGGNGNSSCLKENPDGKVGSKSKSRSGSFLSRSDSSNLSVESLSPPKKTGCFLCSPKKVSRKKKKKNKENKGIGVGVDWGRNEEELMSDLSVFSEKKQQKMLIKAMKEEEKINREAEKIVKWAKQASARMNISDIENELSDNENPK